ncbi:MAG: hypothetical protein QOG93_2406, partial [Gaiellaceae bacterium]|nr:hypothetical protein [Gaiellaceae bacterium]
MKTPEFGLDTFVSGDGRRGRIAGEWRPGDPEHGR